MAECFSSLPVRSEALIDRAFKFSDPLNSFTEPFYSFFFRIKPAAARGLLTTSFASIWHTTHLPQSSIVSTNLGKKTISKELSEIEIVGKVIVLSTIKTLDVTIKMTKSERISEIGALQAAILDCLSLGTPFRPL